MWVNLMPIKIPLFWHILTTWRNLDASWTANSLDVELISRREPLEDCLTCCKAKSDCQFARYCRWSLRSCKAKSINGDLPGWLMTANSPDVGVVGKALNLLQGQKRLSICLMLTLISEKLWGQKHRRRFTWMTSSSPYVDDDFWEARRRRYMLLLISGK
jgi:hypothetical protein